MKLTQVCVSPEMDVVLLRGWVEPTAAGSGGGVDKPQWEEGLQVTSATWTHINTEVRGSYDLK